uniref:N-acyl amino acid synthase FeeM catalytic core domain-containing protein n=1 Tax=Bosea sp. NBC_00436 TaxID=2969620 RepID=A0A9E7ZHT3_9HYPH
MSVAETHLCLRDDRWPGERRVTYRYPAIGVADTKKCLEAIGRLRYELFVQRDGKKYECADHEAAIFLEPIDAVSLNFQATDHQRCLATVRMTWAQDALGDKHLSKAVTNSGLPDADLSITVLNSRLALRPEMRAKLYLTEMFRTVYRSGHMNGARYCLVAARPSLSELYIRFGFRDTQRRYLDEVGGEMAITKLDLHDGEHLRRIRSPLLDVFEELHPAS